MTRVCGVQTDPKLGRVEENTEEACLQIREAAAEGAELVVLPEAALTGYVFDSAEEALEAAVRVDGPETERLAAACAETGAWAVCGAIVREGDGLSNVALVVGPEGLAGVYRKVHTLCLGVDRFTTPGEGEFPVFDLPMGRIGVNICYDGSFPESGRVLRLRGAQLVLLPTNWPDQSLKRELVQVRAYENHVNYFAVNRVGTERGTRFDGGSAAADPRGRLLAAAGAGPERLHVEFDLPAADASRIVEAPGAYEFDRIADRRPARYGPILEPTGDGDRTGSRRAPGRGA